MKSLPVNEQESRQTLIIGDLHGHLHRLEALLKQEGLVGLCDECEGSGLVPKIGANSCYEIDCYACNGDGWARQNHDKTVVLLGDVGHCGIHTQMADQLTWERAIKWADIILWGNHDAAVFYNWHTFGGYFPPYIETKKYIRKAIKSGKLRLAYNAHGFLCTHAGLAESFKQQKIDPLFKEDLGAFVNWINEIADLEDMSLSNFPDQHGIRDCIGIIRGGGQQFGGILWRDIQENLYPGWRQIFGHSADEKEHQVRKCWTKNFVRINKEITNDVPPPSYCIDIGGKGDKLGDDCLAGIWLPSEEIVRVDL